MLKPRTVKQYSVFLASPGDMEREREVVRKVFSEINSLWSSLLGVRFEVIGWESLSAGVGEPQKKINAELLDRNKNSLALMIGVIGQRFGSPTSSHESGTQEEFEWALRQRNVSGWPEIKWFFQRFENVGPTHESKQTHVGSEQVQKVQNFKARLRAQGESQVYYREFSGLEFEELLRKDVSSWINDPARPWISERSINSKLEGKGTSSLQFGFVVAEYKPRSPEELEYPVLEALYRIQFEGVRCKVGEHWMGSFVLPRVANSMLRAWLGVIPNELGNAIRRLTALGLVATDTAPLVMPFGEHKTSITPQGRPQNETTLLLEHSETRQIHVSLISDEYFDTVIAMAGRQEGDKFKIDDPGALLLSIGLREKAICRHLTRTGILRFEELRKLHSQTFLNSRPPSSDRAPRPHSN